MLSIHLNPVIFPQTAGVSVYFLHQKRGKINVLLFAELAPFPKEFVLEFDLIC